VARKERALTVPTEAVRESGNARSVQVVRAGRVHSVKVETGVRTTSRIEVAAGIDEGDTVLLTKGIADGVRVRPREAAR
jgi:hypothetical protein